MAGKSPAYLRRLEKIAHNLSECAVLVPRRWLSERFSRPASSNRVAVAAAPEEACHKGAWLQTRISATLEPGSIVALQVRPSIRAKLRHQSSSYNKTPGTGYALSWGFVVATRAHPLFRPNTWMNLQRSGYGCLRSRTRWNACVQGTLITRSRSVVKQGSAHTAVIMPAVARMVSIPGMGSSINGRL